MYKNVYFIIEENRMGKTVLFDLDGTLTDPGIGITNSVWAALRYFNIEVKDRSELFRFIGPPLIDAFMEYYGFPEEQAREAINPYREYFASKGIFENEVYPGIPELLEKLKKDGYVLAVATSKPEEFAKEILVHFDLMRYFDYVCGAGMDETRTGKAEVITYALETAGVTDKRQCIMIGDRKHDMEGAAKNGLRKIGVLYGYGSLRELTEAGADGIAEDRESLYLKIREFLPL